MYDYPSSRRSLSICLVWDVVINHMLRYRNRSLASIPTLRSWTVDGPVARSGNAPRKSEAPSSTPPRPRGNVTGRPSASGGCRVAMGGLACSIRDSRIVAGQPPGTRRGATLPHETSVRRISKPRRSIFGFRGGRVRGPVKEFYIAVYGLSGYRIMAR